MTNQEPKPAPGLAAILRMMFLSGASDEVVENFVRLYTSEITVAGQPPIIELAPIIAQATQAAARLAVDEALAAAGIADSANTQRPPRGVYRSGAPSDSADDRQTQRRSVLGSSYIYRFRLAGGLRTSVSVPTGLVDRAAMMLGEFATKQIINRFAKEAPADVRRSTSCSWSCASASMRTSVLTSHRARCNSVKGACQTIQSAGTWACACRKCQVTIM